MESKFKKSTDSEHKVKLEPTLIYANWLGSYAVGGQSASFAVGMSFVGYGAPIQISGKSRKGKSLGKVEGKVTTSKFIGKLPIPADIEPDDYIYFDVKLKKQGLEAQSERIPVFPPVRVTNMKWSASEARRGDMLTISADVNGLREGTEVELVIWDYDRDGIHDRIISLPAKVLKNKVEVKWEYEYHQDTDEVPTEEEMQRYGKSYNPPEYFFTIKAGDAEFGLEQESGLLTFKDFIEVEVLDAGGEPKANAEYKIIFADGTEQTGNLDGDGRVRIDDIPPGPYRIMFPGEN
jgi:hypothetical protein